MTMNDIMEMEAGPELDGLMAESLGYQRVDEPDVFWYMEEEWRKLSTPIYYISKFGIKIADNNGHTTFHPSIGDVNIWKILEKVQSYNLEMKYPGMFIAKINLPDEFWSMSASGSTAPLAICHAFLIATNHAKERAALANREKI